MTEHEKSRKHYEQSGTYDQNMEYFEECEVNSGAWVLITRQIPVDERCKPHLFGIYWGIPKQDRFDRQVCVVHTTEDVTLLNHEFTVIDDERLKVYREEGWELHENMAAADAGMNTELIEKGRALCEEAAAPEKRCSEGIVNILKAAVEEIYTGGLAKVTLNLRGGVKASISQNSKGEINVERTETKKQKLTE